MTSPLDSVELVGGLAGLTCAICSLPTAVLFVDHRSLKTCTFLLADPYVQHVATGLHAGRRGDRYRRSDHVVPLPVVRVHDHGARLPVGHRHAFRNRRRGPGSGLLRRVAERLDRCGPRTLRGDRLWLVHAFVTWQFSTNHVTPKSPGSCSACGTDILDVLGFGRPS